MSLLLTLLFLGDEGRSIPEFGRDINKVWAKLFWSKIKLEFFQKIMSL
jgi:hypothetical protein